MTLLQAISERHSVRAFLQKPLDTKTVDALQQEIAACNEEGHLHLQLVVNEERAFQSRLAKYGKFSGVSNYIVVAGQRGGETEERAGYYGERVVLKAQTLGLNTCWVGLTYSKIAGAFALDEGEKVFCVIALGYGATQGVTHKVKTTEQVSNASADTPDWFRQGVEAALKAPTAVNQQKFRFEYAAPQAGGKATVLAKRLFSLMGYTRIDLGIARLHFELGAGKENFDWA